MIAPMPRPPDDWCVAIDGPAASGKTEIGSAIARGFGWRLFDTGILYRALAWHALRSNVDPADRAAVSRMLPAADLRLREPSDPDGIELEVGVGAANATPHLRDDDVEAAVSLIAAQPDVRAYLIPIQHDAAARGGLVVVGRDIGTVVIPAAPIKLFLTASPEVRARRRAAQHAGEPRNSVQVFESNARRDEHDMTRTEAPLVPARDAVQIDTTDLTLQQSIDRALTIADQAIADHAIAASQARLAI